MSGLADAAIANKAATIAVMLCFWTVVGFIAWRFIRKHRAEEAAKYGD